MRSACNNNQTFISSRAVRRFIFVILACWLVASPEAAWAKKSRVSTKNKKESVVSLVDKKTQERIKNRKLALKRSRLRITTVPKTLGQKAREEEKKRAERAANRELLVDLLTWQPGADKRELSSRGMSREIQKKLMKFMNRLKQQMGKPYVWGGSSPKTGFDCSGLVWYAYTTITNQPLPRTANGMFRSKKLKHIKQERLHRGDLIFFGIHSKDKADHVGVYLGGGKFIEAPRTGLNVRTSYLADNFWQDHYLGSRRIIYD